MLRVIHCVVHFLLFFIVPTPFFWLVPKHRNQIGLETPDLSDPFHLYGILFILFEHIHMRFQQISILTDMRLRAKTQTVITRTDFQRSLLFVHAKTNSRDVMCVVEILKTI